MLISQIIIYMFLSLLHIIYSCLIFAFHLFRFICYWGEGEVFRFWILMIEVDCFDWVGLLGVIVMWQEVCLLEGFFILRISIFSASVAGCILSLFLLRMFPILKFLLYPILDSLIECFLFDIFQHPHSTNKNQMMNHCLDLFNFQDITNCHTYDQHPQVHSYLLFQNIQIIEIAIQNQKNIQSNKQKYIITLIMISNILKRLAYTFTQIPNKGGSMSASSQCIKEIKRKQLNMEDLISICSLKNQEFIRGILNKKQRNRQDKINADLHKKFDTAMIEDCQTDFNHLMFVAALRRSNINNKEIFIRNFLSLFLQKSLKYVHRKQPHNTSTNKVTDLSLQSDNPILEQNKQLLLLQATRALIQLQQNLDQRKKQQYPVLLLAILQKNKQKITSLQTMLTILEFLDIKLVSRKIGQSLKYSKIASQILHKIKSIFESNNQYTSNIGSKQKQKQKQKQNQNKMLNYKNQKDSEILRPYFIIFGILSKVVVHDQSLMAYFCGVVAKDGFFNCEEFSLKYRLYFYHRCFRGVYNYVDQNGVNPINQKIIQIQTSLIRQNKLLKYTRPDHIKLYFLLLLQLRFHQHYLKLKSQLVGNSMIITQKPTPPFLTSHQKNLLQQIYPIISPQPDNILYTLIKTHYPQLISKFSTSKPLTSSSSPTPQKQQRQIKYIHNEFMNRMGRSLQKLNIKYQKQVKIEECGKNVDFLLVDDKIVIQCDGDYHIDFNALSISVGTSWRNMLLMLVGYRVVEFGMHQFHQMYDNQHLDKILVQKLQILKNHQAYVVS